MITPDTWVRELLARLAAAFGPGLLYLGLQGSYRRGEATETSDIDLVTILDALALERLDAYRAAVRSMPEGEKACGFICERTTLERWPRHELFQLKMDTADYHGALADFLPALTDADVREGARVGASGLHHLLAHSYLYAKPEERPDLLRGALKGGFFVLRSLHYLRTGVYCASKRALCERLEGVEKDIVAGGQDFAAWMKKRSERDAYALLLEWSGKVVREA